MRRLPFSSSWKICPAHSNLSPTLCGLSLLVLSETAHGVFSVFVSMSHNPTLQFVTDRRITQYGSVWRHKVKTPFSFWLNKVITTMVIGQLDDLTYGAPSALTHLGLRRKLYDCSLHHFTTSKCILKCALLTFSSTSNRFAEIWKGDFSTLGFGVSGDVGVGNGPIQ